MQLPVGVVFIMFCIKAHSNMAKLNEPRAVCWYWLQKGSCSQGNRCQFMHSNDKEPWADYASQQNKGSKKKVYDSSQYDDWNAEKEEVDRPDSEGHLEQQLRDVQDEVADACAALQSIYKKLAKTMKLLEEIKVKNSCSSAALQRLTLKELKDICVQKMIKQSGKKSEVIERIIAFDNKEFNVGDDE